MKAPAVRDIIDATLRREGFGEFTNHPLDRGGATKWGITLRTLRTRKSDATADDVRALTEEDARQIYLESYVQGPGFDRVPSPELQALLVDFGVVAGPGRAVKALQVALGANADGVFGSETLTLLRLGNLEGVYAAVLRQYFAHFSNVVTNNPSQLVFLRGWINRANEFVR